MTPAEFAAPPDLTAIRARCDAATPGPWAAGLARDCAHAPAPCPDGCPDAERRVAVAQREANDDGRFTTVCTCDVGDAANDYVAAVFDAEFIAHARTDIPALLARVAALEAALAAAEGDLRRAMAYVPGPQWALAFDAFICQVCGGKGREAPHRVAHVPGCLFRPIAAPPSDAPRDGAGGAP